MLKQLNIAHIEKACKQLISKIIYLLNLLLNYILN